MSNASVWQTEGGVHVAEFRNGNARIWFNGVGFTIGAHTAYSYIQRDYKDLQSAKAAANRVCN